jgi:uncharacterized protein (TIGR00251 family)
MAEFFTQKDNRLHLSLKITPGSSKSQIAGIEEDGSAAARLKIKIAAAPEDGKANACLIQFLSKWLDCPKKDIVLHSGEKSRLKTISVPLACKTKLQNEKI